MPFWPVVKAGCVGLIYVLGGGYQKAKGDANSSSQGWGPPPGPTAQLLLKDPSGSPFPVCQGAIALDQRFPSRPFFVSAAHCWNAVASGEMKVLGLELENAFFPLKPQGVFVHPHFDFSKMDNLAQSLSMVAHDLLVVPLPPHFKGQVSTPLGAPSPRPGPPLDPPGQAAVQRALGSPGEAVFEALMEGNRAYTPGPSAQGESPELPTGGQHLLLGGDGRALYTLCTSFLSVFFQNLCRAWQGPPPSKWQRLVPLQVAGYDTDHGYGVAVGGALDRITVGESGSPLYGWDGHQWVLVGVVSMGMGQLSQVVAFAPVVWEANRRFLAQVLGHSGPRSK